MRESHRFLLVDEQTNRPSDREDEDVEASELAERVPLDVQSREP